MHIANVEISLRLFPQLSAYCMCRLQANWNRCQDFHKRRHTFLEALTLVILKTNLYVKHYTEMRYIDPLDGGHQNDIDLVITVVLFAIKTIFSKNCWSLVTATINRQNLVDHFIVPCITSAYFSCFSHDACSSPISYPVATAYFKPARQTDL